MNRPRLLDLFCGAGGAGMGYYRAGFDVTGIDIKPQPHYPFNFIQADALTFPLDGYDAYHASPPCQRFSRCTAYAYRLNHPDFIQAIRMKFAYLEKPSVIENVRGAPLDISLVLCGTMFGLPLWRHRYFEIRPTPGLMLTKCCNHNVVPVLISGSPRRNGSRKEPSTERRREAMEIDWMSRIELDQAIPPAYTEYIGKYLLNNVLI